MQSVKDFIKDNKKIGSKKGLLEVPFADGKSYSFSKPTNKAKILVLDTETTGLSYIKDEIIEIAGVGVEVDRDSFEVTGVKALFDYFNQPSEPISPKITEITGITNEDVEGQSYDLKSISQWIRRCDIILAHNATFDRPFVDKLPLDWDELVRPWACSCIDYDWKALGFPNRKLEGLLEHCGYEYSAHRAINDCLATAFLLTLYPDCVRNILSFTEQETFRVSITKNPYGSHPILQERGFAFSSSSWIKFYVDMDEMITEREEIVAVMQQKYKKTPNIYVNQTFPVSRFSAGL